MTKLKTLKDLEETELYKTDVISAPYILKKRKTIEFNILRDIAREWIKHLDKNMGIGSWYHNPDDPYCDIVSCTEHNDVIALWLRHFFNLEEDE